MVSMIYVRNRNRNRNKGIYDIDLHCELRFGIIIHSLSRENLMRDYRNQMPLDKRFIDRSSCLKKNKIK